MAANFYPIKQKNLCGAKIREGRITKVPPITQDQLSGKVAALGIVLDRTAIAKIERGQRCVYDYELGALAHALSLNVADLVEPIRSKRA